MLRKNAVAVSLAILFYAILIYHNVPCLFFYFLHIPCPGCGMTHAVLAALRLDFRSAFMYHPMFWSLPVIAVLILTNGRPTRHRVFNLFSMLLIAGGFLINYIANLFVYFGT